MKKITMETAMDMMDITAFTLCQLYPEAYIKRENAVKMENLVRDIFVDFCESEGIDEVIE